ncbi:MAG: hypothetical protein ACE5LC_01440 [Candidatus Aminicenantales bacterium]
MFARALSVCLILLLLLSCASTGVIKERTRYFERYTFDQVWEASLAALKDLNYEIMETARWRGFIYAERKNLPHSTLRLPLQLSVHIGEDEELGWIKVDCEAILVGSKKDYSEVKRRTESQFFTALRKRVKGKV